MGTPYQYGSRRRRVLILSPIPPAASTAIDASGSLILDDVTASGSSGVAIDATGSMAVDDVAATASSSAYIAASGSLALDDMTVSATGGSTVFASGGLAVEELGIGGSSIATIDATGSLAVDDLTATGSDQIPGVVPRRVVVPTPAPGLSMRRRVIAVSSNTPNSSPVVGATALTRVEIPRRYPRSPSPPVSGVLTTQTRVVTGGNPPPNNGAGGGGSPKPLQSSWIIGSVWARRPAPHYAAIVARTRYTQPPIDGLPNQVTVVAPHRPTRPHAGIVVLPAFKWGVNHGKTPNAPVVVARPTVRRVPVPIVVSSPPTSGLGFPKIAVPVVVRHAANRPVRGSTTILGTSIRAVASERVRPPVLVAVRPDLRRTTPKIIAASTAEGFAVRPPRPTPPTIIPYRKFVRPRGRLTVYGLADAFEMPPPSVIQATVVPRYPRPSDRIRPPLITSTTPAFNPRSIPAFDPVVVVRHVRAKASPWFYVSNSHLFVPPPPPRHDPLSRVSVVPVPRRRSPLMWPRPVATNSILQPVEDQVDKPWDLIAACIAWLRKDARIVSEFGDVKGSERSQKFVSDVELPRTGPPYAVFDEPLEVESYESPDESGRFSSLVQGSFNLSIFDVEKLAVRRKADMVAASLQDAPLLFVDGVLMYLRRSERRFKTVTIPGVGSNVTSYKRTVEFVYMIERFFSDQKG